MTDRADRTDLSWEWQLPTGESLIARLDTASRVESVWLGPRLIARSATGGKREGHTVSLVRVPHAGAGPYRGPHEARVLFDAQGTTCSLRIGDQDVPPVRSPYTIDPAAPAAAPPMQSQGSNAGLVRGLGIALVVVIVMVGVSIRAMRYRRDAQLLRDTTIAAVYPSPNGLLVAHHPETFKAASESGLPQGTSVVSLTHTTRDEAVFLSSYVLPNAIPNDPWKVHEIIQKDVVAKLVGDGGAYDETERRDEKCLGEDGAVVIAKIKIKGESGKLWSCTFVHGGHPYRLMYALADRHISADEALLRTIVDATELTEPAFRPGFAPSMPAAPAVYVPQPEPPIFVNGSVPRNNPSTVTPAPRRTVRGR